MLGPPRSSLYWRLLPSYLLVILVAAVTTFLAGEAVAPFFLERHIETMVASLHSHTGQPIEAMAQDLETGYRRALTQSLIWALLASALAAGLVGLYVTRRIVRPLRAMTRASHRIAGGRYSQRLDPHAPGEVGELAAAFNTMAETLQTSEERRVQLLADVAHEFRTPLSNLRGYLEGLDDGVFRPDEVVPPSTRQVDRLERLADDLSLLSRVETGQLALHPSRVDVATLLMAAVDAFRPRFEAKGVDLDIRAPQARVQLWADEERTGQVLANLIANALRFTPPGGRVTLAATPQGSDQVRFEVRDTGPGVPADEAPLLFNRFYRGDRSRGQGESTGSGIGLTLAKQLVERQGGEIGVEGRAGDGSTFWFTLPTDPRAGTSEA